MVNFSLSDDQKALRNNARAFAQNVLAGAPKLYAHLPDQRSRFQATLPIYQSAVQAGLIKGQVPIPLGGGAGSLVDAAILVEEFYAVEPSAALTVLGTGLGLTPLILAGSNEQREKYLAPFLKQEGQPIASFVHSEPTGTANWLEKGANGLQTTAYRDGDQWVVDGEKLWTTNSCGWDLKGADLACLVCREGKPGVPQDPNSDPTSHILILLVTRETVANNDGSAYQILQEPELTGHKSSIGPHTRFSNFRVPVSQTLCEPGTGAQVVEQTFGSSSALVGAMCVGIMRSAFENALKFCKEDTRGGAQPIIEHQSVADKLMDIKIRCDTARLLTWKGLYAIENGPGGWESRLESALEVKIWAADQAPKAVMDAMNAVGMKSYAKDMPFSRLLEDAICLPLFDGGNLGVRRRQMEKILKSPDYQPWAGVYGTE